MAANQQNLLYVSFMTPPNPHTGGRWGLPMLLKGDPGTAKTALINATAGRAGLPVHTTLTAIQDPTDFAGLPYLEKGADDVTRSQYASPPLATTLLSFGEAGGVCFFDEINCGAPSTQAAALRIILEGVVGTETVSPKIRFIAACNDPEQAPNADDIAMSLANRFGHLDWNGPSSDDWCNWLVGQQGEDLGITCEVLTEDELESGWADAFDAAARQVSGFIRAFPSTLHAPPEAHSENASKAWASRRTWENFTRALAAGKAHKLNDEDLYSFLSAFVGRDATSQFVSWVADQDMPKPADVLADADAVDLDTSRLDRTMAILDSCAQFVINGDDTCREQYGYEMWRLLERVLDTAPDLAMKPAGELAKAGVQKRCKPARAVLSKMGSAMTAAGFGR